MGEAFFKKWRIMGQENLRKNSKILIIIEYKYFDFNMKSLIARRWRTDLFFKAYAMACIFNKSDSCCKDAPKQQHGPVCPQKIYRYVSYDDQISKSQLTSKSKPGSKIGCSSSHHMTTEPSALAVQDEIVPLLGGPYFTCIMSDSHVQQHFRLEVPTGFHQFFPSSSALVVLCSRSREWVVRCYVNEHMKLLENGWKRFVVDNNLRVGDGCVFELMDCKEMFQIKLRVQILPGQAPQRDTGEVAVGQSSENPFMIA